MHCLCPALSGTRWIIIACMHTCFVENRSVLCKHLDTVEITAVSPSFDVDFVGNCQHDIDRSERFRSTNSGQRSVAWSTVPDVSQML